MVRTGARVEALTDQLVKAGLKAGPVPASPRPSDLEPSIQDEVLELYRSLGGLQDAPQFRPGGWDLGFDGGLLVELDEELHFNRYRARTLDCSWSSELPWTAAYRDFCVRGEARCLTAGAWGKRWTNASTARMFVGGEPKDLETGSPRWKQRALYDAMKDAAAASVDGPALARVSIYDIVDGVPLEEAIISGAPGAIRQLVESRRT